jgi:hypothetical protein
VSSPPSCKPAAPASSRPPTKRDGASSATCICPWTRVSRARWPAAAAPKAIEIVEDRADERVIDALQALWSRFGVPRRAQFDNGGPFVAPTGIGEVVRVLVH